MSSSFEISGTSESPLIRLPTKGITSKPASNRLRTLVDKFFLIGALSSFFGGAGIGAHLWLMLNGQMAVAGSYASLRLLHALIQTYLFFGLFILGFLFQTAPKILKVPVQTSPLFLAPIPLLFLGVYRAAYYPEEIGGPLLIAIPFFSAFFFVAGLTRRGTPIFRENYAWWVLLGLCGLGISPFFSVALPENAQLFIWSGVVPVTFAAGQQFLFAFLGAQRLSVNLNRGLLALYIATVAVMFAAHITGVAGLWQLAGLGAFSVMMLYICGTRSVAAAPKMLRDPLAFAFITGYSWTLFATGSLAFYGPQALDGTFHMLTLGWLTPLIIAVSSQVLRAIAGKFWLSPRMLIGMLVLWQLVPVGRSLRFLISLPGWFSVAVIIDVTCVLLLWLVGIGISAGRILGKELMWANRLEKVNTPISATGPMPR